ncbi:MAG TPA: BamA/TamA family outer membrane protein [Caldimonas sp.]|jgi:translocation and assembly module TamA|nr:BamA/TamA family outer membrane protein [Caldimonas sp.]HEX2539957.1 BamA/TamA family outer membrane protein [Caldimonas sp.]
MSRRTAPWRALWCLLLTALMTGCTSLPFLNGKEEPEATQAAAEPEVPLYDFDVQAPEPLRTLLLDYLDLSRFRSAPSTERITGAELDRLAAAAPAQARSLLETEGYFDAEVKIEQARTADGLARLTLSVVPGPRVVVKSVAIDSAGPLAPRKPTREEPWSDRIERIRQTWLLQPGQPFQQSAWSSAKNASLGAFRADGYPTAQWQSTQARIDAVAQAADLSLTLAPGPLFRLGPIVVEGVQRYDEDAVRRLAGFRRGIEYSEKLLLDYQDRIVRSGLFEGASVEVDLDGPPEAAPVTVRVKELTQHQATFGIGFSADTGPRVSVEHTNRKFLGLPWIARSTVALGPDLKTIGTEFTSYVREDLWHNLAAANLEQLRAADETRNSWATRVGRSKNTTAFERLYYAELSHSQVQSAPLTTSSDAVSVNYHWLRRDLDNILLPTRGTALAVQGGLGYGSGSRERSDRPGAERRKGPFARTYARLHAYRPAGAWFLNARVEAGEVFVRNPIAVPDPILFRAGGENSIRGYGFRTIGPTVNRAVVGGRVLLTGSIEAERPITARLPALLGAVFVDAGDAADRWGDLRPVVGYGVGLHYRSPVGPLRLDLAYGHDVRRLRLHLSVGVRF